MHIKKSFEYYFWGKRQPKLSMMLEEFLFWKQVHYDIDFEHEALRHKHTLVCC